MLTHAAVVWWRRVELGVAKIMLGRLQRLACLAITGTMCMTPTAAMETLLDTYIKSVAMNSCYRMNKTGVWWSGGAHVGHTRILDIMEDEIP